MNNDSEMIKDQIEALEKNITDVNQNINSLNIRPDLAESIDLSLDELKNKLM